MINDDTIKILRECNAGIKMGTDSLDEVIKHVKDNKLKEILSSSKEKHEILLNDTKELLEKYNDTGKEPSAMAKGMSWLKTNVQLAVNGTDKTVADLITDGCNMGIKSLRRYLNQYEAAEEKAKDIAKRLINIEEALVEDLKLYL